MKLSFGFGAGTQEVEVDYRRADALGLQGLGGLHGLVDHDAGGEEGDVAATMNGGTHMPFEDVALYRALPGSTVIDVTDPALLISPEYTIFAISQPSSSASRAFSWAVHLSNCSSLGAMTRRSSAAATPRTTSPSSAPTPACSSLTGRLWFMAVSSTSRMPAPFTVSRITA
mgnify:CR=1 FL=1